MTATTARVHFSPANQLLFEARELAAKINGTPSHSHFPRWWQAGGSMWLESSSGSRTLSIDFEKREIRLPEWKGGETREMPENWVDLYEGSLFYSDGTAVDREKFDAAMAQDGWKKARS